MTKRFYELQVAEVKKVSKDSVSVLFHLPDQLKDLFSFKAGQYLTLRRKDAQPELRRSYSICSGEFESGLRIAVKKVQGGGMSAYICEDLKEGDIVEVMPPEGHFTCDFREGLQRNIYFVAAGSGITPILSLIKTGLEKEPKSTFYLLYGNRTQEEIMFYQELGELENKYSGQLHIRHTLSKKNKGSMLKSLWGRKKQEWPGDAGRIDPGKFESFLESYPNRKLQTEFFICGPGDMIECIEKYLVGTGIPEKHIHREYFYSDTKAKLQMTDNGSTSLIAHLDGERYETEMQKGKTILDTLIDLGADPPYSCSSGVCSTCMAKVLKGSVEMETCLALDDDEIEEGYILTCQAHPTTADLEVRYE